MRSAKLVCATIALISAFGPAMAQPRRGGPGGGAPFAMPPGGRGFAIPGPGLPPGPLYPPAYGPPPVAGPPGDAPMRVLTDTREYCLHLANMVAEREARRVKLLPGEHALAVTGRQMCERGLLIGGLERLRVAWRLLGDGD